MSRPENARYTESHEWVVLEGDVLTLGITDFAVEHLGDIVFVDLPDEGTEVGKGETACEIESVKAVGEVYAPAGGTIESVNEGLADDPAPACRRAVRRRMARQDQSDRRERARRPDGSRGVRETSRVRRSGLTRRSEFQSAARICAAGRSRLEEIACFPSCSTSPTPGRCRGSPWSSKSSSASSRSSRGSRYTSRGGVTGSRPTSTRSPS